LATSGTQTFNSTLSDIIYRALRMVGAIGQGDTPNGNQFTEAKQALNVVVKGLQVEGIRMWELEQVVTAIPSGSNVIGSDGNSYYCTAPHTSAAGNAPVTGASWDQYWKLGTTISTTPPAWGSGNAYTASCEVSLDAKYVGIDTAFLRQDGYDYSLAIINKRDYDLFDQKYYPTTIPTHLVLDGKNGAQKVFIYPYPTSSGNLYFQAVKLFDDMTNNDDNLDFPVVWIQAVTYLLAAELANEYALDLNERGFLTNKASGFLEKAKGNNRPIITAPYVTGCY